MDSGRFHGDINLGRASDLPDGFLRSLETNSFLKNQRYNTSNGEALDLCKKLNKMGISCDMSMWSRPEEQFRVDPGDFVFRPRAVHEFSRFDDQNLSEASSARQGFPQNKNLHGVSSQAELRFLGSQDSFKVSQTLATMEGSTASYPVESTLFNGRRRYLKEDKPKMTTGLPPSLASMVMSYGSVYLMAKDHIGSRILPKLDDQVAFLDCHVIFLEIIDHVTELSKDPFGNYFVQKILEVCDEDLRTLIVRVLTLKPVEFIKICLNTYGTRVIQKLIETMKTRQQIALVKSGLKPGFLPLVKDLNGSHVIRSCLQFLGPNDNKLQSIVLRLRLISTDVVCFSVAFQTLLDRNVRDSSLR